MTAAGRKTDGTESTRTVTLTVGTAGHIDHGKTELIKLLTGCDCDRLPEEKARGMTIDLGFATCQLPGDARVGIVDVPGHERFIHNMVAGAAGIDAVLLVVAADDGVMPQTLEHFHIVRLLGVKSGMVAVTKTDLTTPERVADVMEQVRIMIDDSFLEDCAIVPISSRTGEGFDAFYDAFTAMVDKTAERDSSGAFRMHVERSFVLKGLGVIISGIPRSGSIKVGETVELLPGGDEKKVRGLQVYGNDAQLGRAGECIALRLSDVSREDARRGVTVATPGCFEAARFINVKFHYLPEHDRPLKPRTSIRFHIGTSDVPGHMVLPTLDPLLPGSETYAQMQLRDPAVAAPGDFFVARLLSPVRTIGGGYVVGPDSVKLRRSKKDWVDTCREHEEAFREPATAIAFVLRSSGKPENIRDVARMALLSEDAAGREVKTLVDAGDAVSLYGDRYAHRDSLAPVMAELLGALNSMHDEKPLSMGFSKRTVFRGLQSDRLLVDYALEDLQRSGEVVVTRAGMRVHDRGPSLSEEQQAISRKIKEIYRVGGLNAPRPDQLPELVGESMDVIRPVFEHLLQAGEIVELSDKVSLSSEVLARARDKVVAHLEEYSELESGSFKEVLGTSRKYAIPLLEYLDKQGVTKRIGNKRMLRSSDEA